MEYLLLPTSRNTFLRLYFVFSVFIHMNCNKRGQTSSLVAGAQIPTSCNFEKNMYNCNRFLDFVHRRFGNFILEFSYNFMVSIHSYSFVSSHYNLGLHKKYSVLCVIIKFMFRTMLLKDNRAKQFH